MLKRLYYRAKAWIDPEMPMSETEKRYHAERLGIEMNDLDEWDRTVARRCDLQYKEVQ